MKKTPWFPPDVKPVHVGVYETTSLPEDHPHHYVVRTRWDGFHWGIGFQYRYWRGLAEKPKGK